MLDSPERTIQTIIKRMANWIELNKAKRYGHDTVRCDTIQNDMEWNWMRHKSRNFNRIIKVCRTNFIKDPLSDFIVQIFRLPIQFNPIERMNDRPTNRWHRNENAIL